MTLFVFYMTADVLFLPLTDMFFKNKYEMVLGKNRNGASTLLLSVHMKWYTQFWVISILSMKQAAWIFHEVGGNKLIEYDPVWRKVTIQNEFQSTLLCTRTEINNSDIISILPLISQKVQHFWDYSCIEKNK